MRYVILAAMVMLICGCNKPVKKCECDCKCECPPTYLASGGGATLNVNPSDCAASLDGATINIEDGWTGTIELDGWHGPIVIGREKCFIIKRELVENSESVHTSWNLKCKTDD